MYAVIGISFRCISNPSEATEDETIFEELPDVLLPTFEQYMAEIVIKVSSWLDATVQAKGYDSIVSCASYAGDDDETFNAEGSAAKKWRSAVYRALYGGQSSMAQLQPEQRLSPSEVISQLPQPSEFGWNA